MRRDIASIMVIVCLVSGCGGGNSSTASTETVNLSGSVAKLQARVEDLEKKLSKLETDQFLASFTGPQESVMFDPQDDKAYQPVRAPAGVVLVVLEKLEPYLDGFTVSMRLGNPSSASYSGINAVVQWGRKFDPKQSAEYNTTVGEKKIDLKDALPAGAWTVVKFNIAPAKPDEVRRIIFQPTFNSLQLRAPIR